MPAGNRTALIAGGDDDVGHGSYDFRRNGFDAVRTGGRISNLDIDVSTFDPSQLLQFLPKSCEAGTRLRIILISCPQHGNPPHSLRLLPVRRSKACRRTTENAYKSSSRNASHIEARPGVLNRKSITPAPVYGFASYNPWLTGCGPD